MTRAGTSPVAASSRLRPSRSGARSSSRTSCRSRWRRCCSLWQWSAPSYSRKTTRTRRRVLPDILLYAVPLRHVLVLGAILFSVGLYLALSKRNAIGVLMGVELMLNAVNVTLLAFARYVVSPRPLDGQVFAVFVITVAAAEAAVALALAVAIYRHRETVNIDEIDVLRW